MDVMENIGVCEEHRRRKYKKENYFQLSGIYLTFNHRATQRFGVHPGSILRQFYQTTFLLIKTSLRWVSIPFERKRSKTNKKKSSNFLLFKLSVSQATVQVLLNNIYFPSSISCSTTAILKEISKPLPSLSLRFNMEPLCTQNTDPR